LMPARGASAKRFGISTVPIFIGHNKEIFNGNGA
jgi:hypothetical protein